MFDQEKEKDPQGTEQQTFVHFLHGASCTNNRPENCIFLLAHWGGTTIAMKTFYRVVASCANFFISFDQLNFLRSSREVHCNTDFLTSFLHSFTSSKQKRLISDRHKSLDLNAMMNTPEEVLNLQTAMPGPCKKINFVLIPLRWFYWGNEQ